MVLVDTSVWIRFLVGREPYASELDQLLANDEVLGHEFIYGELLIGDLGGRAELLAAYMAMPRATTVANAEVVEFVRHRRLNGRGIGWIDAHLLASAIVSHCTIWTADRDLAALAKQLAVAWTSGN